MHMWAESSGHYGEGNLSLSCHDSDPIELMTWLICETNGLKSVWFTVTCVLSGVITVVDCVAVCLEQIDSLYIWISLTVLIWIPVSSQSWESIVLYCKSTSPPPPFSFSLSVVSLADEREAVQKKTFTKWVNSHLGRVTSRIGDLYTDLRDGRMLIRLLEVLSGEQLVSIAQKAPLPVFTLTLTRSLAGPSPCTTSQEEGEIILSISSFFKCTILVLLLRDVLLVLN